MNTPFKDKKGEIIKVGDKVKWLTAHEYTAVKSNRELSGFGLERDIVVIPLNRESAIDCEIIHV